MVFSSRSGVLLFRVPYWLLLILLSVSACTTLERPSTGTTTLFTRLESGQTGIDFNNRLEFDDDYNIYTYRNFYNGGGVGLGDFNNDGLIDVYLSGNQVSNRLYLNKGNFHFEDITETAGVAGRRSWSTGVSVADVNGDGWLDIYVCNSGNVKGDNKQNELFINQGDLTFTEQAEKYGLADPGYSTHAVFFDYDRDGDLDVYILNNSYQAIGSFNLRKNERDKRDRLGGDKLLRNEGATFVDVSEEAGIYGSVIGFGLGVTVGDFNRDDWPDIYVSNDFFERDYLYINNQKGGFDERLTSYINCLSAASMGADFADINNDGLSDLLVTDMLPNDHERLKTVTTFENWERYQYGVENGYHHQFTRNMLQLNNGDGSFSEIGRLCGLEATDWSWGALIFDMDNDGRKDVFVANGIYQDITNQDFLEFASHEELARAAIKYQSIDYQKLTEIIPSTPVANFAFHNESKFKFVNKAVDWGLSTPGFSNGSAYGDLDNDGDLDLVVNNVNMPCFVYRNESSSVYSDRHYLKLDLQGAGRNTSAIGAKVVVENGDSTFYVEQVPMRGFQSSVDRRPNIGLGTLDTVDRVIIHWPDGKSTTLTSVATNQTLVLKQSDAVELQLPETNRTQPLLSEDVDAVHYQHVENKYVDFHSNFLMYHMRSMEGPRVSTGDVNGDGLSDFYVGGAHGHSGKLFLQRREGKFQQGDSSAFVTDKEAEDMESVFFDADGDGDLDLYVCSGGFQMPRPVTPDRLYLNDGKGHFVKVGSALGTAASFSTSTVSAADFDKDDDLDLFVGERLRPNEYGLPGNGMLLQNDGTGHFEDVTSSLAPELQQMGMITDALWSDIDSDGDADLLVVGEFMPVLIFINEQGRLTNRTSAWLEGDTRGWWNRIHPVDIDNDGDMDMILGNHGLNTRFHTSPGNPLTMYVSDFDKNGTIEHILCTSQGNMEYPVVMRHDLVTQIPSLRKKYQTFDKYKNQSITDVFDKEQLNNATRLTATQMSSCVLINTGSAFVLTPLPVEAQFSPVYGILDGDFNHDGFVDLLLGGNLYGVRPEAGRYDASFGLMLLGDGRGGFTPVASETSGLRIDGEIRDLVTIRSKNSRYVLVARNGATMRVYKY